MPIAGSLFRDMLSYAQLVGLQGQLAGDPEGLDVIRTRMAYDWPGTRLLPPAPPAEVHEFALTPDNVATLIERGMPVDLSLLRADGSVWMAAPRGDVWFELDEGEYAAVRAAIPGLLASY